MTTTDPIRLLAAANTGFAERLRLVGADGWGGPTPCSEWDVAALVNHVVGANRRYVMLLGGASSAEVEATRGDDSLGDDPPSAFASSADAVVAAFSVDGALERTAHHFTGERTGAELLTLRVLDVSVHTWDLARSIGADETLDPDVVEFSLEFADSIELSAVSPSFAAPPPDLPADASRQDRLLYRVGRQP